MKLFSIATLLLLTPADAFIPATQPFGVARNAICLEAKHVQKKAARKAAHNRPKKSRPSDINRKPTIYPSFEKPSEYSVSDAPAVPVTKKSD
mmetsp:Transcript_23005/g.32411  ORF Transcript_23005/g.32411 Transcript_23005/m.32411 type:complete len:92 (-) Transcript_23005:188-463(-)